MTVWMHLSISSSSTLTQQAGITLPLKPTFMHHSHTTMCTCEPTVGVCSVGDAHLNVRWIAKLKLSLPLWVFIWVKLYSGGDWRIELYFPDALTADLFR